MTRNQQICFIKRVNNVALAMLLACLTAAAACAQGPSADQKTELGIRQQLVKRQMVELEKKFMVFADRIREEKPERADLLVKTYQKSKEESLTRKMEMVSELLNTKKTDEAKVQLDEVDGIIDSLIRLLTNEKEKVVSAREEMETLERIKQKIQKQLEQQQTQTRETEKASNKDAAAEKVAAQINALKGLIEKQSDLVKETGENAKAKLNELDKLADKQFGVRKATDELNKNITGEKNSLNKDGSFKEMPKPVPDGAPRKSDPKAKGQKGENSKPSKPGESEETADGDQPPGEPSESGDPSEPGDDNKSQQKPNDGKKPEGKPTGGKGSKGKPSEGEQQQGQPGESGEPGQQGGEEQSKPSPQAPPQPGQKALEKAADHQKRAEEKLGSGKPTDAKRQQQQALDEMKDALSELEKEKRRIESLPPEVLEQLAREQRRNRDKTLDVIEEMKKAPKGKSEDESGGEGQKPQQAPGQQKMGEAQQAQNNAADKMENNDSDGAQEQQKQAEEKMKQALEEIEDRLSQLREETNEEKLARLEARFKEMLDRQKEASALTIEIEDKRANLGVVHHRDQLLILRLATEELEIREVAQQAYDVLLEDGTSIVFPEVVQDIRGDLESAATLLQEDKTDQFTQLLQKEIETGIADLLDALKEAQKKKDGGGGGGGGQGGKQPLLKQSAELKILRMRQRRLNRRTSKLEMMKNQPGLQQRIEGEISEAADMQAKILEMTENIMNKQQ